MQSKMNLCGFAWIVLLTVSAVICDSDEGMYFIGDSVPQNNIEKELKSPDIRDGPLSVGVLASHPNMAFIGDIDNKHYYIDRTNVTWPEGNDTCYDMGMRMATFHNKSESDFVYKRLPASDGIVWTGAKIRHNYAHYLWTSDNSRMFPTNLWAFNDTDTVLVFDVRKDTPSSNMFTVSLMSSEFYTLCFL